MGCLEYWVRFKYVARRRSNPTPTVATSSCPTSTTGVSGSEDLPTVKSGNSSASVTSLRQSVSSLFEEKAHNLRVFEFKELKNATDNFSPLLKIGEGGFGLVFKGFVKPLNGNDELAVAIKKLNQYGLQGHKEWLAEVRFLGVVEHPNLVKLVGYCAVDEARGAQRMLVYEFVTNKTLEEHLFNKTYPTLPWNTRLQIAMGAAKGLTYLHEGLEFQVIYRDFKASNVLLDEEFKPKLSDFGMAREGPQAGQTHVTTQVMGTHGYAAPDYIETGHLTTKSDVWSFGVVLYEILTGRRVMEKYRPREQQKLLEWVKRFPAESKRFVLIMDPRLENKYSLRAAREIAKLADLCLSKHARDRPKMSEVVEALAKAMHHKELDGYTGPDEEQSPEQEYEMKTDEETDTLASTRRRMLHLAKLGGTVNAAARRKLLLIQAANQT